MAESHPTQGERAFWIEPREDGKAYLCIRCDRNKVEGACRFSLWRNQAQGCMWQWDGNVESPTITPSIQCNGGCGRHWIITKGIVHG